MQKSCVQLTVNLLNLQFSNAGKEVKEMQKEVQ